MSAARQQIINDVYSGLRKPGLYVTDTREVIKVAKYDGTVTAWTMVGSIAAKVLSSHDQLVRDALTFYADQKSWSTPSAIEDAGARARAAVGPMSIGAAT